MKHAKPPFFSKLLLPLAVCVLAACGSNNNHSNDDAVATQISEAYVLIDKGEDTKAIDLLTHLQEQGTAQQDVTVALASAYLHRSGIDMIQLYKDVRAMDFDVEARKVKVKKKFGGIFALLKAHIKSQTKDPSVDKTIDPILVQATEGIAIVQLAIDDLRLLPTLNDDQLADLKKAHELLSNTTELTQGNHLYRALVGLVLIKQFLFKPLPAEFHDKNFCDFPVAAAIDVVSGQLSILVQMVSDIQIAFPKSADALDAAEKSLSKLQTQLNSGEFKITLAQIQQYQSEGWLCSR